MSRTPIPLEVKEEIFGRRWAEMCDTDYQAFEGIEYDGFVNYIDQMTVMVMEVGPSGTTVQQMYDGHLVWTITWEGLKPEWNAFSRRGQDTFLRINCLRPVWE